MGHPRVLPPHICLELKKAGYPQNDSKLVWVTTGPNDWDLRERHKVSSSNNKISAISDDEAKKWELEERGLYDISDDADTLGLNRWVSAVTVEQAADFREMNKPRPEPEMVVNTKTFSCEVFRNPRRPATAFATECGDRLINITETIHTETSAGIRGQIHLITVYYWKEA